MGGVGSGRPAGARSWLTVEACRALDVRDLYRAGLLWWGARFVLSWPRDGEQGPRVHGETLCDELTFRWASVPGEAPDVEERVELTWMPCRFGGERPFFICPGVVNGVACRRRVLRLHQGGRYFACRSCYGLIYASQRPAC